jgi:hypothetical protein
VTERAVLRLVLEQGSGHLNDHVLASCHQSMIIVTCADDQWRCPEPLRDADRGKNGVMDGLTPASADDLPQPGTWSPTSRSGGIRRAARAGKRLRICACG